MNTGSRAQSFNAAASQYASSRPSYPPALFDLIELFTNRPLAGTRVADVGAGTGIATTLLRERGAEVIGIEPGDAMAAQFHNALPDVRIIRGNGNALPLASATHDLITYAQSWHWTDITHSVPEVLRVLRPDGALAIWWNTTAFDEPWIREQHQRIANRCGTQHSFRARPNDDGRHPFRGTVNAAGHAPPGAVEPRGRPRHAPGQHQQPLSVSRPCRGRQAGLSRRGARKAAQAVPRRNGARDLRR